MGSSLTTLRANLRLDLKDTDATNYYWPDDEINRAILRATEAFQDVLPLKASISKNGTGSARRFDLSAASGYIYCVAVEYPIDDDPPAYLPFKEETVGSIYILDTAPAAGTANVKFWYAKGYTVGATGDLPAEHEALILRGAAALAVLAGARYAATRLNASQWTPRQLREYADRELAHFDAELARLKQRQAQAPWAPHWSGDTYDS